MSVPTFCTSALVRVLRTFTTNTTAISSSATSVPASGPSGTSSRMYETAATVNAATVAGPIARNITQPYRKAASGPNASRM